jgi:hypothetical protein
MMFCLTIALLSVVQNRYSLVPVNGISNADVLANDGSVIGYDYSKGAGWPAVWKAGKVRRLNFKNVLFYHSGRWTHRGPRIFDARLNPSWAESDRVMAGGCGYGDASAARDDTLLVVDVTSEVRKDAWPTCLGGDSKGNVFFLINAYGVKASFLRLDTVGRKVSRVDTHRATLSAAVSPNGAVAELVKGAGVFVHPPGSDLKTPGFKVLDWSQAHRSSNSMQLLDDGTLAFSGIWPLGPTAEGGAAFKGGRRIDQGVSGLDRNKTWRLEGVGDDGSLVFAEQAKGKKPARIYYGGETLSRVLVRDGLTVALNEFIEWPNWDWYVQSINTRGQMLIARHGAMRATIPYLLVPARRGG